ncbi:MAG: CBS domain-containing protein [Gemmatimonadetes bacterium]|jgi:CBS domain-containing protein|nr:CBS domain-containing protein [Gemmatimonadota bacterium]MBT6147559.1 CBS domain-containing protein [Gemmatimonadota bacterium]MBT7860182.1 CBS domain-containing protein [Gemmatimonadota bacterium]
MATDVKTAEQILQDKGGELIAVAQETVVVEALKIMVESKVGSILIKDGSRIVGIYTERDLMRNTIEPTFDPTKTTMSEVMTVGLRYAPHTDTAFELMDKFLGLRLRHLLIDRKGEFIGLLSIGDAVRSALQIRTTELATLQKIANWEYYEEWKPRS